MFTIGCHLSSAKGYLKMAQDAASIDGNTFQFFTRNPRGGKAKAIDPADVAAFHEFAGAHGITTFLAHAPYTMNPAAAKPETRAFAIELLTDDLMRMENTPGQLYNMHPGCHVGQGAEAGIALIADALNQVLTPEQSTTLLLETMAGKGTEVGGRFEELAAIIDAVELDEKVGVCLDTCHVWDGGYNIAGDLDGVLEEFDRVIGLDRLRAIHLNDSKNPLGAHKDRHAPIGEGCIGFDALAAVTNHPALRDLPFFLETRLRHHGHLHFSGRARPRSRRHSPRRLGHPHWHHGCRRREHPRDRVLAEARFQPGVHRQRARRLRPRLLAHGLRGRDGLSHHLRHRACAALAHDPRGAPREDAVRGPSSKSSSQFGDIFSSC